MKESEFAALLVLTMLPLLVLPLLDTGDLSEYGRIRIHAAGISTEVYTTMHGQDCGCCGALWNGGQAIIHTDASAVRIGDVADMKSHDGEHLVLECAEVATCIRVGRYLIGRRGILRTEGDVLLCTPATCWPFVRVLRLIRL